LSNAMTAWLFGVALFAQAEIAPSSVAKMNEAGVLVPGTRNVVVGFQTIPVGAAGVGGGGFVWADAGWQATGHGIIGERDRHLEGYLHAGTIVKGRTTRGVIGYPEGACARGERHAPGIPQDWILEAGYTILVRDELVDDIGVSLAFEAVIIGADDGRTGDRDRDNDSRGKTATEGLHHGCPPFLFEHWLESIAPRRPSNATRDDAHPYDSPNRLLFRREIGGMSGPKRKPML
jgi:hypothetical protein